MGTRWLLPSGFAREERMICYRRADKNGVRNMKMVKTGWISLLSLALAVPAFANEGHQLLLSQSKAERATTLAGILQTSGKTCETVSRSFLQGTDEANRAAYWNAECSGGETYVIQIPPSNKTRVLECKIMEMIGVKCFTRFDN